MSIVCNGTQLVSCLVIEGTHARDADRNRLKFVLDVISHLRLFLLVREFDVGETLQRRTQHAGDETHPAAQANQLCTRRMAANGFFE